MVVILVHWLIKKGREEEFKIRWKERMTVPSGSGLYREILTRLDPDPKGQSSNPKFHTFSLGDPFYSTFINIGIWESVEHFDEAVGKKYIPEAVIVEKGDGRQTYSIEVDAFEFKLRERTVLEYISDRGKNLPEAQLPE